MNEQEKGRYCRGLDDVVEGRDDVFEGVEDVGLVAHVAVLDEVGGHGEVGDEVAVVGHAHVSDAEPAGLAGDLWKWSKWGSFKSGGTVSVNIPFSREMRNAATLWQTRKTLQITLSAA